MKVIECDLKQMYKFTKHVNYVDIQANSNFSITQQTPKHTSTLYWKYMCIGIVERESDGSENIVKTYAHNNNTKR